jgi:hypothetical protein
MRELAQGCLAPKVLVEKIARVFYGSVADPDRNPDLDPSIIKQK